MNRDFKRLGVTPGILDKWQSQPILLSNNIILCEDMMNTNIQKPKELGMIDLASLGLNHIAYYRPGSVEGRDVYVIFAANGTQIGLAPSAEAAALAIKSHDMEPASVN